jgi:outer membrane lipoprotein SlyB
MSVERFKIAALPVNVGKLLMNSPVGGALAGGALGGLTSLVSGDDHPLRDIAVGAGAGGLHGHLGQQANVLGQRASDLESRMGDVERVMAARRAASAPASSPASPGIMDMLGGLFRGRKSASFASIFPSVAGPALGGFGGRMLATKYHMNPDIGMMLGGITGGTAGQLVKEKVEAAEDAAVPPGAPYSLDATSQDIPPWALQGAQLLQPRLKQSAHGHEEPWWDIPAQEVPGFPVAQAAWQHGPMQAAKTFGGMALGGGGGALVGKGLGMGLEHLLGMPKGNRIPLTGLSLSDLLAGLGGTIGGTHGMRLARP